MFTEAPTNVMAFTGPGSVSFVFLQAEDANKTLEANLRFIGPEQELLVRTGDEAAIAAVNVKRSREWVVLRRLLVGAQCVHAQLSF